MKRKLLLLNIFFGIILLNNVCAQTFTVPLDTVYATVTTSANIHDDISNLTSGNITINWKVISSDFPHDWAKENALGICDACFCRSNLGDTAIWNTTTNTGTNYSCSSLVSGINTFDLTLNLTGATSVGTHYLTVKLTSGAFAQKNVTFVINKFPAGINNVAQNIANVVIFPNPAKETAHLNFNLNEPSSVSYSIVDATGRVIVAVEPQFVQEGDNQINISTANIPAGIYEVIFNTGKERVIEKLSIIK